MTAAMVTKLNGIATSAGKYTLTTWSNPGINNTKTLSGLTVGQLLFVSTNDDITITNATLVGCNVSDGGSILEKTSGVYIVSATSVTLKVLTNMTGDVLIWT